MAKTRQGLFIGIDGEIREVTIDTSEKEGRKALQDYYDLIETDIVERVTLTMRGFLVEVWCGAEAPHQSAAANIIARIELHYPLYGNVVVHGRSLGKIVAALRRDGYEFSNDDEGV